MKIENIKYDALNRAAIPLRRQKRAAYWLDAWLLSRV